MYYLWHTNRIDKPSEYWNLEYGDKLVLRAFVEKEIKDKYSKQQDLRRKEVPVFVVDAL